MNPKVSVLVPIYNVSLYIERCAESLFNQTFTDIEYIFVNDATPDDSIEKLLKTIAHYPERSNQVKIINHRINRGLATTRNTALDASIGDYIAVVDSDDYIDSDMIEHLYKKAVEEDADIVISDIIMQYHDHSVVVREEISENSANHFIDIIKNEKIHSFLCNKLIRRSLYLHSDCRVPEGLNYYEDRHVMTRLFYYATKIVKVNGTFYHYIQYNAEAITKSKDRMHFENVITFWNLLDTFLKGKNEYEKYRPVMELPKVKSKIRLMLDTHSMQLRKEYASMFYDEETKYLSYFKRGEKLMLLLVRYKMFRLAQWFYILSWYKNKKLNIPFFTK